MEQIQQANYFGQENSVRETLEEMYKQKLKEIQGFYSEQNKSLKKTLEEAHKQVLSDELLVTMIADKTTSKFIEQRVEECFQEIVFSERQIIIENQNLQIAQLNFQLQEAVKQLKKIKTETEFKEAQTRRSKEVIQNQNSSMAEQVQKKTEELLEVNKKLKEVEQQLKAKTIELKNVMSQNQKISVELKTVMNQKQKINQILLGLDSELKIITNDNLVKCEIQIQQIAKSKQTTLQLENKLKRTEILLRQTQSHLKKLNAQYKAKIRQYKQKMTQLIQSNQTIDAVIPQNNSFFTSTPVELQKRLAQTIRQHEKRFTKIKEQKQKEKNQLERKYESRQRQTQEYYEKLLQKKVAQVEGEASEFWENMKRSQSILRKLIRNYEENCIPREEHQAAIKERESLIFKMKEKIDEDEKTIEENETKTTQLYKAINDFEEDINTKASQIVQLQNTLKEHLSIIKRQQQQIFEFKQKNKRAEEKINSLHEQIKNKNAAIAEQKQKNARILEDSDNTHKLNRQKQIEMKQLLDQIDDYERKCKKLQNQLLIVNNNYNAVQHLFKDSKMALSNLEFKVKQLQHDQHLNVEEHAHKTKKLSEEIQIKGEEIKNLNIQFKIVQEQFLALKSTHAQTETLNKKLQLEIKYYKETESVIKQDSSAQVNDLKIRMSEKNNQIQRLKAEINKIQALREQKVREFQDLKKLAQNKLKSYEKGVDQIERLVKTLACSFNKQIDMIRSNLKNFKLIFQNEISLHQKTFHIQLVNVLSNIDQLLNQQSAHFTQKSQQEKQQILDKSRHERELAWRTSSLQFQKQKQSIELILQQKDKQLSNLSLDCQMIRNELSQKKHEILLQQKKVEHLQKRLLNTEQQQIKKLKEMSNQYEVQKRELIEEFQQKKHTTDLQIQELIENLQKVKIQMEAHQTNYEREKIQIASQLKSVQEQENNVREAVVVKDQEIKRLDDQLRKINDHKIHLENTLRELSEHDQQKMMRIHELQYIQNQLNQSMSLVKVKLERTEQQNNVLKQSLKENEETLNKEKKNRIKAETELKDIKAAIDRNDRFRDLRALQQMTVETQQLTNKVSQMKKMSQYLDQTPLRS